MNSKQYTIRSVPPKLDKALRKRAKKTGMSLNGILVNTLKVGIGLSNDSTYNDLDHLFGAGISDQKSFDASIKWLDSLPNDLNEDIKNAK